MKIATWNVNSVRARLPRILPWLEANRPDVLCLQETKCEDRKFPRAEFEELGYGVETYGQKTYNGVAIAALGAVEDAERGLPGDLEDSDRRVLTAAVGEYLIVDVYVVNGQEVGSSKYAYKLEWMARLRDYIASLDLSEKLVLCGDFNVTVDDRDVYDPDRWRERILCSTPEREALRALGDLGLHDAFRRFEESGGHYTWWDFRTRGFARGNGLRIDHFLVSDAALEACTGVTIDTEERGRPKPSDHAPVVATFA